MAKQFGPHGRQHLLRVFHAVADMSLAILPHSTSRLSVLGLRQTTVLHARPDT